MTSKNAFAWCKIKVSTEHKADFVCVGPDQKAGCFHGSSTVRTHPSFARAYNDTIDTFDTCKEQPNNLLKSHTFLLLIRHYWDILLKKF